jgi:hypothetical protein
VGLRVGDDGLEESRVKPESELRDFSLHFDDDDAHEAESQNGGS